MKKKGIIFICGIAACTMLSACSGEEAAPTAAGVSQSAASSESSAVLEDTVMVRPFDKWIDTSDSAMEEQYQQARENFESTSKMLNGFRIYTDAAGEEYIFSGFTPVKLVDGKIPESAVQDLRTEKRYQKVVLADSSIADEIRRTYNWYKSGLEVSSTRGFKQYISAEYDFTGLTADHIFINNIAIDIDTLKFGLNSSIDAAIAQSASHPDFSSKLYMDTNYLDTMLVILGATNVMKYTPPAEPGAPYVVERPYADGTTETFEITADDGVLTISHGGETETSALVQQDASASSDADSLTFFSLVDLCDALQVYIDYQPSEDQNIYKGIVNFITDTYDIVVPDNARAVGLEDPYTNLWSEYQPPVPSRELTEEENATYQHMIELGITHEEAAAYAIASVAMLDKHAAELEAANEKYIRETEEREAQEFAEREAQFKEIYGMSYEEFDDLTGDEIADLRRKLIHEGKLPMGGVAMPSAD